MASFLPDSSTERRIRQWLDTCRATFRRSSPVDAAIRVDLVAQLEAILQRAPVPRGSDHPRSTAQLALVLVEAQHEESKVVLREVDAKPLQVLHQDALV